MQLVDQLGRDLGQLALVGVGKPGGQFPQRHPGHLADLYVFVGQFAAEKSHQIMVHGFVHSARVGDGLQKRPTSVRGVCVIAPAPAAASARAQATASRPNLSAGGELRPPGTRDRELEHEPGALL